jgi:hypothetical protein
MQWLRLGHSALDARKPHVIPNENIPANGLDLRGDWVGLLREL